MPAIVDNLDAVNRCQIAELKKAASILDPAVDCVKFYKYVQNVQSAIMHTYQLSAYAAIRQADPKDAAKIWKEMADFCDIALSAMRELRLKHPLCGTGDLYDLALDYKAEAQDRYYQNLQDSECQAIPAGLFAEVT
jgi:hypothetical protein